MVLPGGYNVSLCSSHMGLMVDPGQLPSCNITALMREVPLYKRYNTLEFSPYTLNFSDLLNNTCSSRDFTKEFVSLCSSHMVDLGQLPSCNITALVWEKPLYKRYNILEVCTVKSRMYDLNNTSSFQDLTKELVTFKMEDLAKFWASMCYSQEFKKKLPDLKAKAQCVFVQSKPCRVGWISWTSEDIKCVLDALKGTEIYEHTQDQRKGDGDPKPGRKLLSQSREGPRLEVSDRPAPGGLTTLDCKARGFSTPDIALVWLRNGEPRPEDTRQGAVLPSTDGTFETGAAIDIDPSPGDTYTCRVERPSLPGGLSKDWGTVGTTSNALLIGGVIGGVLTGGVLLGAAIAGGVAYLLYRRHRRRRRRQAEGSQLRLRADNLPV